MLSSVALAATGTRAGARTVWEGTHVGGHLGWTGAEYGASPFGAAAALTTMLGDNDGFAGGFLYGASWQFNNWLLGTDSVWTFSDTDTGPAATAAGLTLSAETNYATETRARVGYLFLPDLLLYGAVGIAFADVDMTGTALASSGSERFFGITYGGGLEAMFNDRWFARVEYAHTDFDDESFAAAGGGSYKVDLDTDAVRGALGYRFDWSPLDLLRGR